MAPLVPLIALLGCTRGPADPQSLTVEVLAAEGAELVLDAQETLSIPPGGLDRDASVTFARTRCDGVYASPYFAGCAYEVLSEAVPTSRYTVTFPVSGEGHVVARERDVWRALLDSTFANDAATATRSVWSALSIQQVAPQSCVDPPFTACGGDVLGEWRIDAACIEPGDLGYSSDGGSDPFAACAPDEVLVEEHATREGTLTFTATGEWSQLEGASIRQIEITTEACRQAAGTTCLPDCTEHRATCTCDRVIFESDGVSAGNWSLRDATTLDLDGGAAPYCITGDTLVIDFGGGRYTRYSRP